MIKKEIIEAFTNDDTFILSKYYKEKPYEYGYLDGLADDKQIKKWLMNIEENIPNSKEIYTKEEGIVELLDGNTLVFVTVSKCVAIETKKSIERGIEEPGNERVMKGPKNGFVENILTNLALIRKYVISADIKIQYKKIGEQDNKKLAIVYMEGLVNKEVLDTVNNRLKKTFKDCIDSNAVTEAIRENKYSPFRTIGDTERPDLVAINILQGRVAILIDGTPMALIAPYFFNDNFQSADDYYLNFYYASVNRLLRILSFIVTISVPGLYIAFLTYHHEFLPTKIALSIAASREGVPFPTFVELLILLIMFEFLRESGAKTPNVLGTSLSVVGALIIGQATVDARLVSASVVVVVALSSVTGLLIPRLINPSMVYRILILIFSALLGIHGFMVGFVLMVIHLMGLKSFNQNYVSNMMAFDLRRIENTYYRKPHTGGKK